MKLFGRKSAGREASRPVLSRGIGTWTGAAQGDWPRGYEAQVRDGFVGNPVAQRAVRLVSEGVASAPLTVSDETVRLLVTARSGGQVLLETLAMHLLLHGNAFVQVLPDSEGLPRELFALRPERLTVEVDGRGWPAAYLYRAGERVSRLAAEDEQGRASIVHIRSAHPLDDHYGLGCLGAAAGAIAIHNAATRWNKALLDNAARPSGAMVYDPGDPGAVLAPEQFDRLRAEMDAQFSGAANAGRPMLLEGGLRWQPLSLTPADMDFVGLKAAAAREIALAFGVPPMLLGLPGDAAYANYREANRALWRSGILPVAAAILDGLADGLRPHFAGLTMGVDLDRVTALSEDRERLWAQVSAADFLSADEKRAMVGMGPESALPREDTRPIELKFNPWHDSTNGQFTFGTSESAGSASSTGTSRCSARHAAVKPRSVVIQTDANTGAKTYSDGHVEVPIGTPQQAKVGARTLTEVTNILTNETNGLSGGASGELERAKIAVANAIHNGLVLKNPPQVAPHILSTEASSSVGRSDDEAITVKVYASRVANQADPVEGAVYYGTSPSLMTSRRIGGGRQDVLQRFGPFDHGRGPKQYVYIYGDPRRTDGK